MAVNPTQPSILNLSYLPSRLFVLVLYLISFLSLERKKKLGAWLGNVIYKHMDSRARIGRKNLSACFPDKSKEEIEVMTRQCLIDMATGFIEGTHAWWQDMQPYKDKVRVEGLENVLKAQSKGKGVLILGGHFAVVDFAIPLFSNKVSHLPLAYMYRPNNNIVMDTMIEKGRARANVDSFTKKQLREMQAYMQKGGMVWYGCDQDFGKKSDVFAPFFDMEAANISTPTWIANQTGCAVIFMGMHRCEDGNYLLTFSEELKPFGEDAKADAVLWNKELERSIMRYPTQYFWVHKRFKTRPEGEPKFY